MITTEQRLGALGALGRADLSLTCDPTGITHCYIIVALPSGESKMFAGAGIDATLDQAEAELLPKETST